MKTTSFGQASGKGVSITCSAMPQRRQNSIERVLTSFIFGVFTTPSPCSMRRQPTPCQPSSAAKARPTGPPPTISTGTLSIAVLMIDQPTLACGGVKPYIETMSKLGYVVAAALAIAAMGVAWQAWTAMADVQIGVAGFLAMIFGAVGALALGGVLMALLFISNRRGFDDEAG